MCRGPVGRSAGAARPWAAPEGREIAARGQRSVQAAPNSNVRGGLGARPVSDGTDRRRRAVADLDRRLRLPPVAPPEQTHQIGEVADRVGLSLRTVRYYEEQGLVVPEARTEGGFRLYTERQIDRLLLVRKMKPLGFSLDEMRTMFDARETLEDPASPEGSRAAARETIATFSAQVDERTAKMRRVLEQSEQFARELRGDA